MTLLRITLFLGAVTSFVLAGPCGPCCQAAAPVKVTTFYESLCPDSMRFIREQLHPTYMVLKDIMELDLNAYGKADDSPTEEGGYTFNCQHGDEECQGNIALACAKKLLPDVDALEEYTYCMMKEENPPAEYKKCAEASNIYTPEFISCYEGVEGQVLLHEEGIKQSEEAPHLYYVPWIIIDDKFTEANLVSAQRNLTKLVCDSYQGTPPEACNT